jgi:hypothetical protein
MTRIHDHLTLDIKLLVTTYRDSDQVNWMMGDGCGPELLSDVGDLVSALSVRGHEKVPACGQVVVPAGGQIKVPAGGQIEVLTPR